MPATTSNPPQVGLVGSREKSPTSVDGSMDQAGILRRDAPNATLDSDMTTGNLLGDKYYEYAVPDTYLKYVLRRRNSARYIDSNIIDRLLVNTAASLRGFAKVSPLPESRFHTWDDGVDLMLAREQAWDEYPNLYCGDVAQLANSLRYRLRRWRISSEFSLQIYWDNGNLLGKMDVLISPTRQGPGLTSNRTESVEAVARRDLVNTTAPPIFDNSFDVPGSTMRIHLLPDYGLVKLNKEDTLGCFAVMEREIGLHHLLEVVTKMSSRCGGVQLSIDTSLFRTATNLTASYDFYYIDASKAMGALRSFFKSMDEVYSIGFQVYRTPNFIARGTLSKWQRFQGPGTPLDGAIEPA